MVFFGTLMILNVRRSHNRVAQQINDARSERLRANNRQMIIMLACQVLITAVFSIPFGFAILYYIMLTTVLKRGQTPLDVAVYVFTVSLFRLLNYTNPVTGFYIYTLAGSKFRREMKRCVRNGLKFILTIAGLRCCLTLRNAQDLFDEDQAGAVNRPLPLNARGNAVPLMQHQQPMHVTSAV